MSDWTDDPPDDLGEIAAIVRNINAPNSPVRKAARALYKETMGKAYVEGVGNPRVFDLCHADAVRRYLRELQGGSTLVDQIVEAQPRLVVLPSEAGGGA